MENAVVPQPENDINEQAWLLWNKTTDIANDLWTAFEQYFLQKIIDMDDEEYEKRWLKNSI
jgi:hypothetical protein